MMDEIGESVVISPTGRRLLRFRKTIHAKIAKTSALCFTWICLGLYSEVLGPTLPTLMHNTRSDYEHIGMALSTRAIGLLFGSLFGGILSDRFKGLRGVFIMSSLIVGAISTIIVPWCSDIIALTLVLFIAGVSHGFLTTNGNPLLASVWEAKAAGPFSLMHSGYGMGAAIAPLLIKPFTLPSVPKNDTTITSDTPTGINATNNNTAKDLVLVDAVVPYSIISGIIFSCVAYFLCIICIDQPTFILTTKRDKEKITSSSSTASPLPDKKLHEKSSINLSKLYKRFHSFCLRTSRSVTKTKILVICCTFVTFFTVVGNERVFGKFMFTYALYGPVRLSTSDGYLINLIYWVCFCSARIITFFIALYISENIVLITLAFGTLLSSIGLIVLPHTKFWFFLCTTLFSLFKSPLFPATLGCINNASEISGFLVIIVNFGSSSGATLLQYTAGNLIQTHGQFVFPYLVMGTACLLVITACILIIGLKHIGSRFRRVSNISSESMGDTIDNNNNINSSPLQTKTIAPTLPRTSAIIPKSFNVEEKLFNVDLNNNESNKL
uniref:MFS domain-containing protein n=2 Tax=Trichobilharzia regenti TaxID=157069 RepID=A0AA85JRA5_TRIRE|nr:unnamed protein product [Trichobilharzia regenti]